MNQPEKEQCNHQWVNKAGAGYRATPVAICVKCYAEKTYCPKCSCGELEIPKKYSFKLAGTEAEPVKHSVEECFRKVFIDFMRWTASDRVAWDKQPYKG